MGKGIVAVIFSCCLHAFGAIEKKNRAIGHQLTQQSTYLTCYDVYSDFSIRQ